MKKIISALLMLSMLITGITITPNTTKNVQAATTIKSNKWYTGMTDGDNAKVYTYKMQSSGYFYYQVIVDEDGYYYEDEYRKNSTGTYVYTSMIKNYKTYENEEYARYSDGGFKSSKYSFKTGDKITIKVFDARYYKTHYKVKVTFVKRKNFEKENNNSKSKANNLKKGVTYTGLAMKDDVDWFVFKAPKTKKYKIKAVSTNENSCYEYVDVYKGHKKLNDTLISSGYGWKTVFSGKLKKGQKIHVKIYNGGYDEMYKIKAQ